jgi:hypothetical protein
MKNSKPMYILSGTRSETAHGGDCTVTLDGKALVLKASLAHLNKSPTGFNWGYGGSGPSQLAFEVCRRIWGKEIALRIYQRFKEQYIAPIQADSFTTSIMVANVEMSDYFKNALKTSNDNP